jgi:hypothetical protein
MPYGETQTHPEADAQQAALTQEALRPPPS